MKRFYQATALFLIAFAVSACTNSQQNDSGQDSPYAFGSSANKQGAAQVAPQHGVASQSSAAAQPLGPALSLPPALSGSAHQVSVKRFSRGLVGEQRYIALTFDDGPHGTNTPRLLDILKRHGAKATFYVLGSNVKRYPSIMSRMVREGHEVGVHTWSHPNLVKCTAEKRHSEMSRSIAQIHQATGVIPKTMRPPYGAINSTIVNEFAANYGLTTVMWSVDPLDWKRPGPAVVATRLTSKTRPGSVLLLHDIHAPSIDAAERAIIALKHKGYRFVTVSELIALEQRMGAAAQPPTTMPIVEEPHALAPSVVDAPISPTPTPQVLVPSTTSPVFVDNVAPALPSTTQPATVSPSYISI